MTTDTTTLTGWLLEQIAADEAVAKAAGEQQRVTWATTADTAASVAGADAGLFILFNGSPARVIATCAAHRAIVEYCESDDPQPFPLRALASIYADRPGFDARWAL